MKIIIFTFFALISTFSIYGQKNAAWIKDFKKFQKQLHANNINTLKSFMPFPLVSKQNQVWTFVYGSNHEKYSPFTAEDFDKYEKKIFPPLVQKSIIGIDIERLFEKGNYNSIKIQDHLNYAYLTAFYYEDKGCFTLEIATFNYPEYEADEVANEEDLFQINYSYYFKIENNKYIRLVDMYKLNLE